MPLAAQCTALMETSMWRQPVRLTSYQPVKQVSYTPWISIIARYHTSVYHGVKNTKTGAHEILFNFFFFFFFWRLNDKKHVFKGWTLWKSKACDATIAHRATIKDCAETHRTCEQLQCWSCSCRDGEVRAVALCAVTAALNASVLIFQRSRMHSQLWWAAKPENCVASADAIEEWNINTTYLFIREPFFCLPLHPSLLYRINRLFVISSEVQAVIQN